MKLQIDDIVIDRKLSAENNFNHWNELCSLINSEKAKQTAYTHNPLTKRDVTVSEFAQILLNGLNTASGSMTKPQIEEFVLLAKQKLS